MAVVVSLLLSITMGDVAAAGRMPFPRQLLAPTPPSVTIASVRVLGAQCPSSAPSVSISGNDRIEIQFGSNYGVTVPTSATERQKSCNVIVDLTYPTDWSYVATGWSFHGWVELAPRLVAQQSAKYYHQGGVPACERTSRFAGGWRGLSGRPYTLSHTCPVGAPSSPCGAVRALNVITTLAIDNARNTNGQGSIKSTGGNGDSSFFICQLSWTKC
ncbi:hypothetical protein CBR_g11081 [Chara braunii]|uniref:DUF4360 domain-containing protein n=1 Tax=Chara braunii TaxID=69332 RepID=A0A388KQ70_CHABU|nr:hypothetical protein CBR_g11081 [Chara braunii]|eukprot:GBG72148.1 hypothetical protein CBR_g11081 [Chara braunii]